MVKTSMAVYASLVSETQGTGGLTEGLSKRGQVAVGFTEFISRLQSWAPCLSFHPFS